MAGSLLKNCPLHIFRPIKSPDSAGLIEGLREVLDHRVAHDPLRRANSTNFLKLKTATRISAKLSIDGKTCAGQVQQTCVSRKDELFFLAGLRARGRQIAKKAACERGTCKRLEMDAHSMPVRKVDRVLDHR
jgi:hypothetical protein